jgi:adenylate kinase
MRIVILGPPGSGKGTQAALISKKYGLPHIMPAELLHGDRVAGVAVHENPLLDFAGRRLRRKDATAGFIIDGFPRTLAQALALDEVLTTLRRPIQMALRIVVDADAMIQRLAGRRRCRECGRQYNVLVAPTRLDDQCDDCGGSLRQRVDDTEEVIDNRLRVYENLSNPVVAYYRANGLLCDIQGVATVEEVFASITAALDDLRARSRRTRSKGAAEAVVAELAEAALSGATVAQEREAPAAAPEPVTPQEPVTTETAPPKAAPRKAAPRKAAPKKAAPKKAAPKKAAPKKAAPKKAAPKKAAPKKAAPKKAAPKKAAPKKAAPKKAAPKKAAPKKAAPKKAAPKKAAPKKAAPKKAAPKKAARKR